VFVGLPPLGRERADGLHVHETVGDVPGDPGDRRLTVVDESLPATDQRRRGRDGQPDHRQKADDEHRLVAPQHYGAEQQGHETAHDPVRHGVDEVLEALAEAQHPFGQRSGEVVVEERRVLPQQLVHREGGQVLDPAAVHAVEAVQADAPQQFREQHETAEGQHVRQDGAKAGAATTRKLAHEPAHGQRREVELTRDAQRGQH
jgi:hypothetical protein